MLKSLRPTLILTALLLPLLGDSSTVPAFSQERQGCFMVTDSGQLIDLEVLCPTPDTFVTAGTPELGTGDIQVTLRWATTDDLDLYVTDPSGAVVSYMNTSVPSGGELDVDANAGCGGTTQSPIENIFWPPSQAPEGQYNIEIDLYTRCAAGSAPIPFEIRLLVQGTTQTLTGTVSDESPRASFPFSLPLAAPAPQ